VAERAFYIMNLSSGLKMEWFWLGRRRGERKECSPRSLGFFSARGENETGQKGMALLSGVATAVPSRVESRSRAR
jgi:hypothetical protein